MQDIQNIPNPDVNSYDPNIDPGGNKGIQHDPRDPRDDIEKDIDSDVVPVPPDVEKRQQIEEPSERDDEPLGDVDDSPKRFAV
jgi:hypothetical protein